MALIKKRLSVLLFGGLWAPNRSEYLLEFMTGSGYNVSCVFPEYYFKTRSSRNPITKAFNKIFRVFFAYFELLVKASFADVIYVLPGNSGLIYQALGVAKLFKNKVILELYDTISTHYLDNAGAQSITSEAVEKVKKDNVDLDLEKERVAINQSDYIVLTTKCESMFLSKVLNIEIPEAKVFTSPIFCPDRALHYSRKFMEDGIFRICWWGSFLPVHGLDYILEALKQLKQAQLNFHCDLFGAYSSGSIAYLYEKYQKTIESENLNSHVTLRRDLTFSDGKLPAYLIEKCDLALGIFGATARAESAVPNKLIEALSMELPSLTRSSMALKEFFEVESDLWICDPTPAAMAQAITDIYHQKAYPVDWAKTRNKVLAKFNAKNYQETISQILNQIEQDLN
jgi:glycosyltransferase involved in cell wall biosynthesis